MSIGTRPLPWVAGAVNGASVAGPAYTRNIGSPNRRRRRLLWLAAAAVAALVAAVLAIVLTRGADADACGTPRAAPAAELARLPAGLSFDGIGPVTEVRRDGTNLEVDAVTGKPLDEVTVLIQDAVTAAGYRPAGMDNEGDEAEVFFNKGTVAAGQARVEESGCEGRWDIELVLLDRDGADS